MLISLDQNGQNVVAQVSDNTYELVHTLQTGNVLQPDTEYFARVLSRNPGGVSYRAKNLPLIISSGSNNNSSWQIINFRTQKASVPTPDEEKSQNIVTTRQETEDGQTTTTINWTTPVDEQSNNGYRIDIFNNNNILIKQINMPAGSNQVIIKDLPEGQYSAIIYADDGKILEKIAPPVKIHGPEPFLTNFQLYSVAGLLLLALILWRLWQKVHSKGKFDKTIKPTGYEDTAYNNRT